MEPETTGLNPSVNLKMSADQSDKLELIDNLEINSIFKKQYLIPYLNSLWESLSARALKSQGGLPQFAFLEVKIDLLIISSSQTFQE